MILTKNSTSKKVMILMVDSTDHVTPKTGLTLTVTKSKNGGAFGALSGSVAEVANGWYAITPAAGDVDTGGDLIFHATGAAADPADRACEVVDTDLFLGGAGVWDELTASHAVQGSYGEALKPIRASTATAGSSTSLTLDAGASTVDNFYKNCWLYLVGGTGAGQCRRISRYDGTGINALKAQTLNAWATTPDNTTKFVILPFDSIDVVSWLGTLVQSTSPGAPDVTIVGLTSLALSSIESAIWEAAIANHETVGTFGVSLQSLRGGKAQAGSASTITLDAGASAIDDFYVGQVLQILNDGSTGANQLRLITAYNGTTKVATISPNWKTNPAVNSTFVILSAGPGSAVVTDKTGYSLTAAAYNDAADALLKRDMSAVEASAAIVSLCTAILKLVSRFKADNAGNAEIYRTNGTTVHARQAVSHDPITAISELGRAT